MSPRHNDTSPEKQQARSDATEQTVCGAPVNGGLQAWLQVAGSFFLFFNSGYLSWDLPSRFTSLTEDFDTQGER